MIGSPADLSKISQGTMQLFSTITCPAFGDRASETMPTYACVFFYVCKGCGVRLKPKEGDCCVFCSYGDPSLSADSGKAGERREYRLLQMIFLRALHILWKIAYMRLCA
jgi:hypothetical protein